MHCCLLAYKLCMVRRPSSHRRLWPLVVWRRSRGIGPKSGQAIPEDPPCPQMRWEVEWGDVYSSCVAVALWLSGELALICPASLSCLPHPVCMARPAATALSYCRADFWCSGLTHEECTSCERWIVVDLSTIGVVQLQHRSDQHLEFFLENTSWARVYIRYFWYTEWRWARMGASRRRDLRGWSHFALVSTPWEEWRILTKHIGLSKRSTADRFAAHTHIAWHLIDIYVLV